MDAKLTLKLDHQIIEQAKKYSKAHNISLSRLIENYLQAITSTKKVDIKITPLVESLTGVIQLNDQDHKKKYADFLSKKYS